jgi:hypothetical protein
MHIPASTLLTGRVRSGGMTVGMTGRSPSLRSGVTASGGRFLSVSGWMGAHRYDPSMTERLSYNGAWPGSRRAPCLGCGGRVVTARDPHVEIGGKRDGSVLMMIEAEPQLMLASYLDRIFEPGLELLGIAHRGCAQLARQRLEAQEVDLPDDLPQLVIDEGVGEQPVLHLPPAPGRCAFCGGTDLTDEHVWPKWLSRELSDRSGFTVSSPHGPRRVRSLDLTAPICVTCNNRWLGVLESDVRPVLAPLICGEERTLTLGEQQLLATWSVKTALMLDLWSGKPLIPTFFYCDLRLRRCPHEGQLVWLGAYRDRQAALAWHDGLHVGIAADEPPNAFVSTFTAFRVVFQVSGAFDRGITFNDGRLLAAALTRVWPPSGQPVDWPPRKLAFGDESLAELARSVKG